MPAARSWSRREAASDAAALAAAGAGEAGFPFVSASTAAVTPSAVTDVTTAHVATERSTSP
jgi:hypothetical protein